MVDCSFVLALLFFCLVIAVFYIWQKSKKAPRIPGLKPTSERDGNFRDITKAGSLHEFLLDLHKQFGPIASFWFGKIYTVSIASAELFREHVHVFDRPPVLFEQFRTLIDHSVQYANNDDGRARRRLYDKGLTPAAVKRYYRQFQEVANDISNSWSTMLDEQHVPLTQYMFMLALKAILQALFVNIMKDDKEVLEFKRKYDQVMAEMERRATDTEPPTEARENLLQEGKKYFKQTTKKVVDDRKAHPPAPGEELLLDLIIEYTNDDKIQFADALTFTIGGFHTTGSLLTWAFYYIATHPDVDKKVYEEIKTVLGDRDVDHTTIGDLVYIRQVIDETLRTAVVAPFAARFQDVESKLGGYKIPKNTPVVHALGVACKDENIWPLPDRFDPDRLSKEQRRHRSRFWFSPFGFAGKRMCPGQHFAYAEVTVALVTLLRKFKVHLFEGQDVTPIYRLVSLTKDEIWITLSKR